MKKLLLLLLLFPLFSFAQVIPDKANQITVVNNETAYANFIDVKLLLAKKGIEIANLDKEAFQIESGPIAIEGSGTSYYTFICRDDKIIITGKINSSNTSETIANTSKKDTPAKLSFDAMNDLAKLLGAKLKYEISE
ncbi:hypothetical protein LK994_13440 [Ferruginibacter lapsinanis]|uniref:hypothetical protein n=1 Tax=Ferruginibacter lapsinanis TaxID=563172 RepID=UPI001E61FF28|nr:hypothetical protein [Ferruginibacter lapsinanis]UEG49640.1 hypothetical protein LK994_13440 [Ferruginibacter lapsinanis]